MGYMLEEEGSIFLCASFPLTTMTLVDEDMESTLLS